MTRDEWAIVQAPFAAPRVGALEAAAGAEMRDLAKIEKHVPRLPQSIPEGRRHPRHGEAQLLFAAGLSASAIAREIGIHPSTAKQWRRAFQADAATGREGGA